MLCAYLFWGNDDDKGLFTKFLSSTTFDVYLATKTLKAVTFMCV